MVLKVYYHANIVKIWHDDDGDEGGNVKKKMIQSNKKYTISQNIKRK